ncbi:MTAP family purine nucleoside phosphorylase [Candidatus Woesearchaeota archaeon]|nr:MTAP family purine nucleoside phosphorylase [Candidatus Woesearchaeota archaeon]
MIKVGIIGGTGLEDPAILKEQSEIEISTPYGAPSSNLILGKINNIEVVILSRHGKQHEISPTLVNNKANIYALKELGVTHIIATTACGSLREEIERGDLIILDQFIEFTRFREHSSFNVNFTDGIKHCAMPAPFDENLRSVLCTTAQEMNLKFHEKGTVITIEGPRFSTKAESKMYRILGADVVNMSIAPECILANEIKIPYAAIAISTDYDSFRDDVEPVSWDTILTVFKENVEKVKDLIINTISKVQEQEKV